MLFVRRLRLVSAMVTYSLLHPFPEGDVDKRKQCFRNIAPGFFIDLMLVLALRKIILFVCNSFFILNCRSLELFTFAQAHSSVVLPLVSALWKTIVMDYD